MSSNLTLPWKLSNTITQGAPDPIRRKNGRKVYLHGDCCVQRRPSHGVWGHQCFPKHAQLHTYNLTLRASSPQDSCQWGPGFLWEGSEGCKQQDWNWGPKAEAQPFTAASPGMARHEGVQNWTHWTHQTVLTELTKLYALKTILLDSFLPIIGFLQIWNLLYRKIWPSGGSISTWRISCGSLAQFSTSRWWKPNIFLHMSIFSLSIMTGSSPHASRSWCEKLFCQWQST